MCGGDSQEAALDPVVFQQFQDPMRDRVLPVHAQAEAGERDSELCHDDKTGLPARLGQNAQDPGSWG